MANWHRLHRSGDRRPARFCSEDLNADFDVGSRSVRESCQNTEHTPMSVCIPSVRRGCDTLLHNASLVYISHLRVAGILCLQPLPFVWLAPARAEYNIRKFRLATNDCADCAARRARTDGIPQIRSARKPNVLSSRLRESRWDSRSPRYREEPR